jgi:hypothetical protein
MRLSPSRLVKPVALAACAVALAAPGEALAKDLRGRVGVGFHSQLGQMSALSARYALPMPKPTQNVQVELDVGLDVSTEATNYMGGGRVLYGFLAEDNLTLYGAAGAAWIGGENNLRVQPALGAEFFLFGLENLGFSAEWGLNLDMGENSGVRTVGAAAAGVHYWF